MLKRHQETTNELFQHAADEQMPYKKNLFLYEAYFTVILSKQSFDPSDSVKEINCYASVSITSFTFA